MNKMIPPMSFCTIAENGDGYSDDPRMDLQNVENVHKMLIIYLQSVPFFGIMGLEKRGKDRKTF